MTSYHYHIEVYMTYNENIHQQIELGIKNGFCLQFCPQQVEAYDEWLALNHQVMIH